MLQIVTLVLTIAGCWSLTYKLDGPDWRGYNANQSISFKAIVPGSVYSDLERNGILAQDIYYGTNDVNYRWVAYDNWTYEKTFEAPADMLSKQSIELVCDGLDTVASVFVNDNFVGQTNDMFIRYRFNIKPLLSLGLNRIRISFDSPVIYAKRKSIEQATRSYIIPPVCPPAVQNGECHFNFIRKMAASFSWDWGPAFPTSGIWKSIRIEAKNSAIIQDMTATTIYNRQTNTWNLNITLYLASMARRPVSGQIRLMLDNFTIYSSDGNFVTSPDGSLSHSFAVQLNSNIAVKRWWPNGMCPPSECGDGHYAKLYQLTAVFAPTPSVDPVFTKSVRIGFRTIEIVQTPISPEGLTFYFKVNDVPVFAKGTNWIPAHVLTERITRPYLYGLLKSARDANMNMIRIWGGGIYETDEFYEIADELGLMLWHDLMFACALYPTDTDFLATVSVEVTQQIRRLQHHPSIVVWGGNNENEVAISQFWWPELLIHNLQFRNDYRTLYISTIMNIVQREDTSRPFASSSPSNGLKAQSDNWISLNPQDNRYGDVHFYSYDSDSWDWHVYPSAKFASEYGFQSLPSLEAWSRVGPLANFTYPVGPQVSHRQHHAQGNQEIENGISRHMRLPRPGGLRQFDYFVYLSQIYQAMSIKTETEFYRRNRDVNPSTGEGMTMGALYWQLNDIWPGISWSSIEYGGKWKMLHYTARDMFAPIITSPYEDANEMLKVSLVSDIVESVQLTIDISVHHWTSLTPFLAFRTTIMSRPKSAGLVYAEPIAQLLARSGCFNRTSCLVRVLHRNETLNVNGENFFYPAQLKELTLPRPQLRITNVTTSYSGDATIYSIAIATNDVAIFVWLDFVPAANIQGHFSHNGFNMVDEVKVVKFVASSNMSVTDILDNLVIKTLADDY